MNKSKSAVIYFAGILIAFTGCHSIKISIALKPPQTKAASPTLLAGAARADITPPPGYPMGGFGMAGRISRGWWTHLYAKAIYFEDNNGQRMVLVSCDLWSLPAGLADRVTEILAQIKPNAGIGREQIVIAATHTHHSPGNYSSSKAYNLLSSLVGGFDNSLFQFLANRIALAISGAIENQQPAIVKFGSSTLIGYSRNRSLEAFRKNDQSTRKAILEQVSDVKQYFTDNIPPSITSEEAFRAINPTLSVLRVESQTSSNSIPIAVVAFFAVHPTAMGPTTEVYSSDIFGVASTLVEQNLESHYYSENNSTGSTVVAIFNGAEGDISPNWYKQDRQNTLRIGEGIARGILEAYNAAETRVEGPIEYRYELVQISDRTLTDLNVGKDGPYGAIQSIRTARKGLPGVAMLGGAEDGRTFLYHLGFREGIVEGQYTFPHGYKPGGLDRILKDLLYIDPKGIDGQIIRSFAEKYIETSDPDKVPLGIYKMGSLLFATLPGEFTVALGSRVTRALRNKTNMKDILLIGLANEYLSYFTTPQEYNAQHYEGASTMYGEASGPLIEQELCRIATLPANSAHYPYKLTYKVGEKLKFNFSESCQNDKWKFDEGLANLIQDTKTGLIQRNFPQFSWIEARKSPGELLTRFQEQSHPLVYIEALQKDSSYTPLNIQPANLLSGDSLQYIEASDRSLNFVTVIDSCMEDSARWRVIWMVPPEVDVFQTTRFRVELNGGKTIYSKAFVADKVFRMVESPLIQSSD